MPMCANIYKYIIVGLSHKSDSEANYTDIDGASLSAANS